jgi:uncharacterized protein (TIGR02328 family)
MRIWHENLIPRLCRQHLVALWREGLGCYKIITENKKGYSMHPATLEFKDCPDKLYQRLEIIRCEMLKRGYKPKELPPKCQDTNNEPKEWQTLEQQIERLKEKRSIIINCKCNI